MIDAHKTVVFPQQEYASPTFKNRENAEDYALFPFRKCFLELWPFENSAFSPCKQDISKTASAIALKLDRLIQDDE